MLVHHLYDFLQITLTIPKTRDLVNRPAERHTQILSTLANNTLSKTHVTNTDDMKGELAAFLQDLKKTNKSQLLDNN